MHLSPTPPLFVMTHFQFSKRGPAVDEQCPYVGGGRPVKAGHCVCNLDLGRGGETCGGIFLSHKKACFVLLSNVNVSGTRAS